MKKKTHRKILYKKLDDVVRQIVRKRGSCERCGNPNIQTAHIFSRRNLSVRWDLDNVLALCLRCHIFWAHKEPILFTEFVKEKMGTKKFNQLRKKADASKHWEIEELEDLLEKLKGENNRIYK